MCVCVCVLCACVCVCMPVCMRVCVRVCARAKLLQHCENYELFSVFLFILRMFTTVAL